MADLPANPILRFLQRMKSRPRISSVVEVLAFLAVCWVIDYWVGPGNRFREVEPHPFWIIILLVSIQYNTNDGLLAMLFCSAALLGWNLPNPSINENQYEYLLRVIGNPMMWTVATVVVGEMTARLKESNRTLLVEVTQTHHREQAIAKAYKHLKEIKETMETKLVGQLRSSIDSFNAVRSVDNLNPVLLLRGIGEVVRTITGPEQFSVYLFSPNGFELISQSGWLNKDEYSSHFDTNSPLFTTLTSQQRVVCVINSQDAAILEQEGVMAGPLIDPIHNSIFGMIKIERLDFMQLTQTNVETFRMMLEWAGATFAQARQYQKAYTNLMHNPKSGMLSHNFYKYYRSYLERVIEAHQIEVYHFSILLVESGPSAPTLRIRLAKNLVQFAKDHLPKDLLLFTAKANHSAFALIPLGADKTELAELEARLKEFCRDKEEEHPSLSLPLSLERL